MSIPITQSFQQFVLKNNKIPLKKLPYYINYIKPDIYWKIKKANTVKKIFKQISQLIDFPEDVKKHIYVEMMLHYFTQWEDLYNIDNMFMLKDIENMDKEFKLLYVLLPILGLFVAQESAPTRKDRIVLELPRNFFQTIYNNIIKYFSKERQEIYLLLSLIQYLYASLDDFFYNIEIDEQYLVPSLIYDHDHPINNSYPHPKTKIVLEIMAAYYSFDEEKVSTYLFIKNQIFPYFK